MKAMKKIFVILALFMAIGQMEFVQASEDAGTDHKKTGYKKTGYIAAAIAAGYGIYRYFFKDKSSQVTQENLGQVTQENLGQVTQENLGEKFSEETFSIKYQNGQKLNTSKQSFIIKNENNNTNLEIFLDPYIRIKNIYTSIYNTLPEEKKNISTNFNFYPSDVYDEDEDLKFFYTSGIRIENFPPKTQDHLIKAKKVKDLKYDILKKENKVVIRNFTKEITENIYKKINKLFNTNSDESNLNYQERIWRNNFFKNPNTILFKYIFKEFINNVLPPNKNNYIINVDSIIIDEDIYNYKSNINRYSIGQQLYTIITAIYKFQILPNQTWPFNIEPIPTIFESTEIKINLVGFFGLKEEENISLENIKNVMVSDDEPRFILYDIYKAIYNTLPEEKKNITSNMRLDKNETVVEHILNSGIRIHSRYGDLPLRNKNQNFQKKYINDLTYEILEKKNINLSYTFYLDIQKNIGETDLEAIANTIYDLIMEVLFKDLKPSFYNTSSSNFGIKAENHVINLISIKIKNNSDEYENISDKVVFTNKIKSIIQEMSLNSKNYTKLDIEIKVDGFFTNLKVDGFFTNLYDLSDERNFKLKIQPEKSTYEILYDWKIEKFLKQMKQMEGETKN